MAKEVGFDIPKSFIISHKSELNEGKLISKSVYETYYIKNDNGFYTMFTERINKGNIKYLPTSFFPSFIQEEVFKAYELRIFYIKGEFYSMAIFSQINKQTELNFRKYDWVNPNRRVPYNLPKEIKDKIRLLCKKIGLNCCSIDMIVSKENGKYYFLEINPTGEFGMVAQPCNYELYKKTAKTLIKMDKNEIRTNNFKKK